MNQRDRENAIHDQERRDNEAERRREYSEAHEEKVEEKGRKWVTGEEPSGRVVMVPLSEAKDRKLTNVAEANADDVNKTKAARHVLPLLYNSNDSDPGILQMIDKLDQKGKLGPIASRWNEFLSGTVGAGDPDYTALRTRLGLATTKLMQAHVGSRGGAFMLEHFEDLANAKKLNAANLRAGIDQELRYVHDISQMPSKGGAEKQETQVHNGFEYTKGADGQWHKGKAVQP
jgi:hypothetical protein